MNFKVGDTASLSKTITDEDINAFACVSGDSNPLHLDDDYAASTRFGGRIAHGMLGASLISAVLGTKLPGTGSIYLSQTLKFLAPVRPGDTIVARATITEIKEGKPIITLQTVCENHRNELVIKGEAVILFEG
jgi:3-hydroxybutyryl-CoA dehydratase